MKRGMKSIFFMLLFTISVVVGGASVLGYISYLDPESNPSKYEPYKPFLPIVILLSTPLTIYAIDNFLKYGTVKEYVTDIPIEPYTFGLENTLVQWTYPQYIWANFAEQEYKQHMFISQKKGLGIIAIIVVIVVFTFIDLFFTLFAIWFFFILGFSLVKRYYQYCRLIKYAYLKNETPQIQISRKGILINDAHLIQLSKKHIKLTKIEYQNQYGLSCLCFHTVREVMTHDEYGPNYFRKKFYIPIPERKEEEGKKVFLVMQKLIEDNDPLLDKYR